MSDNYFYITTTLPYVNAKPHIGFALEIVQADAIARFKALQGASVVFNTGTDEHGVKIYRKAQEEGKEAQAYVDEYAQQFDNLKTALNLSYTNFIRTTNEDHKKAAQDFWKRCLENGDIYKKQYSVKYCSGCELEKTDSEIEDGKCPIHPSLELEMIEEENYFFSFSKYQEPLLALYSENDDFVVPHFRFNEIKKFVEAGLQDFSVSRLKEKMPWGVPVPGDADQVMYVWFDALINYISTLGWPHDVENFERYWPGVQVAGKDNLRQQSAMWQAMLLSAKLPPSRQILIHGFITSGGQKMSKSTGNVIDPFEYVERYNTDSLRYYLLRYIHPFEDSDFTQEKFEEAYTADLSNGLGNLVSRVTGLIEQNSTTIRKPEGQPFSELATHMDTFRFDEALKVVWGQVAELDGYISATEPWNLAKEGKSEELQAVLQKAADDLYAIAVSLEAFMPATSDAIKVALTADVIKKAEALFPRLG